MNQTKSKMPFLGIELLNSFTKKELQKFDQFIKSPYYNTDKRLIFLFETLQKEMKTPFTEKLQSKIYQKVFEGKKNIVLGEKEKKVFRAKLSILNQLAHKFLVVESLGENQNAFNNLLYKCLLDKRKFGTFQQLIKRDKKRLAAIERKEIEDFEQLYKIEMRYLEYLFLSGFLYKKSDFLPNEVIYKLDIQYLIKKLSLFSAILSGDFLTNKHSINLNTLLIAKDFMKLAEYASQPNLIILNATNNFLQESSLKAYQKILILLDKHGTSIPLADLKGIYLVLLNFLSVEIRKGNLDYEKDLINLYFLMDNQNLLLEENLMPVVKLKNIVASICKIRLFEKAKYFIEKYIPFVRKEDQKSILNLCLAYVHFYQKDYYSALEHIAQVENVNITIEFNHRLLMMKIYYESDKDYSEKTERFFRSAEKFFNENKSSTGNKDYKNFAQILINLYRLKHYEGKMTFEKLMAKLNKQELNADKKWLLEKMDELKK